MRSVAAARRRAAPALSLALLAAGCAAGPPEPAQGAPPPPGCPRFSDLSAGLPTTRGWRTNPSLGDVNGDGYLDLAVTTRKGEGPKVFLYDPQGRWVDSSDGIALDLYPCGVGVDLVDVTGDGRLDLLVADHCTGLYVFRGDGTGRWQRTARLQHSTGEGFNDAEAGDLDGDGRMDLVGLAAFTTGLTIFLQDERGSFTPRRTNLPRSGWGYQVRLGDLDGDGLLDIYATLQGLSRTAIEAGDREAKVWLQRRDGRWEPGGDLPEKDNFYGIALGDLDGDGRDDLAMSSREYEGGIRIYDGSGPGTWRARPGPAIGEAPGRPLSGLAMADFNLDGHLDLVAVEHPTPAVIVWISDGRGGFAECPEGPGPLPASYKPGWGITAGDINRDGRPDIVAGFGSETGGALRAWATSPREP